MISRLVPCAVLAAALLTMPAQAEPSPQWRTCTDAQSADREQQIKACTAIIDSPATSPADRATALNHRGMAWLEAATGVILGDIRHPLESALADFTEAIRLNPKFRDAYLNRGFTWYTARDWQRAIEDYTAAIKIDPDYARSYSLRLELYRGEGELLLAIGDLTELIRLVPKDPELYEERGQLWIDHGDHEHAIADFTSAIKLNPKALGGYARLGRLLIDRGEFDRAIAVYSQAIAIDEVSSDPLADRAYAHFLRGDYAAAAADFHGAIERTPLSYIEFRAPFRYVMRIRAGQSADAELAELVKWMAEIVMRSHPLLDLYLGRVSPDVPIREAGTSRPRRCEADFFVGQWHLLNRNRDLARKHLQDATHDDCKGIDRTYRAALIELKRMGP